MYPERIVCLAAEIPEILYQVGALDRVVGISAYTKRPEAALYIEKVTGFQHGSIKRILRNEPDIAILTSGVQKTLADELASEGVPILHLNPHRLDDMFDTIQLIGNLVGRSEQAVTFRSQLKSEIETIRLEASQLPWRPRVYFEEWMDPLISGTAWVSDLIEIAGGQDVFRNVSVRGRRAADRVVQTDQVVEAAPDIILVSWCGKPFEPDQLTGRDQFCVIPAVRSDNVYEVDSCVLQCGPMLVDSLREIHAIIKAFVSSNPKP